MTALTALDVAASTRLSDPDLLARTLEGKYANLGARELVSRCIGEFFSGRITLVSSFGSGAAVLLHMVAKANPQTPVLFVDTGKHFGETLRYRDQLVNLLGLQNVTSLQPLSGDVSIHDPQGILWSQNPDACCAIRKVAPLNTALQDFDAWFTGRRQEQSGSRQTLRRFEVADGRIKVNPLASWTTEMVDDYFAEYRLPRHPLEADGFLSVGCMTCTDRVAAGEDPRAGRWRGQGKSECGIHLVSRVFQLCSETQEGSKVLKSNAGTRRGDSDKSECALMNSKISE